jgi:hypothetical protein
MREVADNRAACQTGAEAAKKSWSRQVMHVWHVVRDVLRGYLLGQPPDDSRPRKGCC